MAAEWQMDSLGALISVKHGFAFRGEFIHDDPRCDVLLTPGNFAIGGGFKSAKFKYYDGPVPEEYVLHGGDLVVTMTDLSKEGDTLGYPALVPASKSGRRYLHNQRLGKILIKSPSTLDQTFLHYLLCSREYRDEVLASATGTSIKHTSPERICRFCFRRPPLSVQRAIAQILGTLDDKIELNRRMNETLEAMARAIFKDWFVDFGPTRAKMEGRTAYLASEIWALFPDELDSGGTPLDWRSGCLDDLLILQRGFDLPNEKRTPGPYVVMAASGPNGFHDQFMVAGPGVTTGRSGVLGKVFFIHEDFWPLNTSLWVKQFKASTPVYAYFLLQNLDLASFNAGSAVPTLNRNHVHKLQLPVPSKPVVMAFDETVMPLFMRRRMNELESDTLVIIRDLLLPKLMSGEVRLREAEKIVGAVA